MSDPSAALAELVSCGGLSQPQSTTGQQIEAVAKEAVGMRQLRREVMANMDWSLRDYYRTIEPARALAAEALKLERDLSDLVNEAYGLTPEEIALLKLARLIRDNHSPSQRLEKFLRWSLDEFIFVREPVLLAFHQLTGNLPSPILRNTNSKDPEKRMSGVRNALWDLLLLREWHHKLDDQSTKNRLWLLCSRDATVSKLARKLVIVGDISDEHEIRHRETMLTELWGQAPAKRINNLYQELISRRDDPQRLANQKVRIGLEITCSRLSRAS